MFFSSQYYRREEVNYRNRPSSRTDSDYHRRYSPVPFDYAAHIEMLDPLESMTFWKLLIVMSNNILTNT